jgi:hypothetical protein
MYNDFEGQVVLDLGTGTVRMEKALIRTATSLASHDAAAVL